MKTFRFKRGRFARAVKEFRGSSQTAEDYYAFVITTKRVLEQGDGIVWSDVTEILGQEFETVVDGDRVQEIVASVKGDTK